MASTRFVAELTAGQLSSSSNLRISFAFRGTDSQVTSYEIMFLKITSWDQLGLLLRCQLPYCLAISLPELLEAISELIVEFPILMVLRCFNLPTVRPTSKASWHFMITMAAIGLSQVVHGLTVFLLEQCDGNVIRWRIYLYPSVIISCLVTLTLSYVVHFRLSDHCIMDPIG